MMRVAVIRAVLVGLVMLTVWTIEHAGGADGDGEKIALKAESLLLARCEVCHSADLVRQQRLDRAKWEATVEKMIHWGADLSWEDAALLEE